MTDIIAAPGIQKVSDWFRWYLVYQSAQSQLNADCIAMVISLESGFDANVKNMQGARYAGLIGFGGKNYEKGLTYSAERQLEELVMPLFESYPKLKNNTDCGDYYMAVFLPGLMGESDDFVIGRKGDPDPAWPKGPSRDKLYVQNNADGCPDIDGPCYFDHDKKGYYTIGDVKRLIRTRTEETLPKPRIPVPDQEPARPSEGEMTSSGVAILVGGIAVAVTGWFLVTRVGR